ncbi:phosphoribomutase PRM15 Ecym_4611 [Eremothecium cymbalariae DBVPG|uniref:Phosphoribomutase n=1 Tax=Eremothecium cymbalariae (strain CBS 270.75 / DBVPG 7215 / KCTC 17166 / NRRL Y-17582) TaxID=931890 RepID=G8JSB8_ERECY|nr:hypothetical protein Ecym_4611 [Eremothecium cymbalariae DBVPG\
MPKTQVRDMNELIPDDLRDKIDKWFKYDKNPQTTAEIRSLVDSQNWNELRGRLCQRISFGTAGLRARMEAGFARMNTLTVIQASQGLATYIKSQFPNNLKVVVGHDHRYNSKSFAEVAIAAFLQLGFEVYYLNYVPSNKDVESYVHTPMVPFTVSNIEGGASCGIMITASHNPKMDNGYKVYYSNGCQITPPHDKKIASEIDANLVPWDQAWDAQKLIEDARNNNRLHDVKQELIKNYVQRIQSSLVTTNSLADCGKNWFVYTPMHGVGYEIFNNIVTNTLHLKEDEHYLVVGAQKFPDPEFTTVSFPNPEEEGALNLAIELAARSGAELVLANDPDADRFSAAVKDGNKWKQLTGNQLGYLFAVGQLEKFSNQNENKKPLAMLGSTVSSQMIAKMADVEGFTFVETLTGFKWLANRAIDLENDGFYVPFAYEEAIGYMFSSVTHDKDGVSAATEFLQMAARWKKEGKTPLDVLNAGYEKYGNFVEYNGYYSVQDLSIIGDVFKYIRNACNGNDVPYPSTIGNEFAVASFRDLTVGYQSDTGNHIPNLPVSPGSHMITCVLKPLIKETAQTSSDYVRFTIRGSGTEPKLKVYIESNALDKEYATKLAKLTWDVLKREWFRPEVTGLQTKF